MNNPFRFTNILQATSQFSPTSVLTFIIHFPKYVRLFNRLLRDSRVPFQPRFYCYCAFVYLLSPIDLLRDLPFFAIGYIDDIMLLIYTFRKLYKESPPEIIREHVLAIREGK